MSKKILTLLMLVSLFICVGISGCNSTQNESYVKNFTTEEALNVKINFDNLKYSEKDYINIMDISNTLTMYSHTAVVAEYLGEEKYDLKYDKFKKLEDIYGEVPENELLVALDFTVSMDYETGKKYILILNRYNVAYKPFPYYETVNVFEYIENGKVTDEYIYEYDPNLDFNLGGGLPQCIMTFENISGGYEVAGIIRYAAETYGYDGYMQMYSPNILRGENLESVINNADFILKVKALSKSNRIGYDQYDCEVTDILKRKEYVQLEIVVDSVKDSMEPGKEYIIALYNKSRVLLSPSNKYFTLAADNGIIPLDDEALVEEFYKYYNK